MKVSVVVNTDKLIIKQGRCLCDTHNPYTDGIIIETDIEELVGNYRLVNGELEKLSEEEKQIDICDEPTAEERITQLEADKEALAQNVYMLAEVLEALLGGEEDGQEESITEDTAS